MTTSLRRAFGLLAVAALALSACSSSGGPRPHPVGGAAIQPPDTVKTAGKLVWCVDVSYPPEEFYADDGSTAQGSDIDIANEIGKRFGVSDRDRQHRLRRDHRRPCSPRSAT